MEEYKNNINHRCQVVPFNSNEWAEGYIAGVINDKESGKSLYAIKLDDGRRIVKVCSSSRLHILDEIDDPVARKRKQRAKKPVDPTRWTPEVISAEIDKIADNVGRMVTFEKFRALGDNSEKYSEAITGRIISISADKKIQKLLYRIAVSTPTEADPYRVRYVHKLAASPRIVISDDIDEEGKKINAKYRARREAAAARAPMTSGNRVVFCEDNLKRAEEKLKKAQAEVEARKAQLAQAKEEAADSIG